MGILNLCTSLHQQKSIIHSTLLPFNSLTTFLITPPPQCLISALNFINDKYKKYDLSRANRKLPQNIIILKILIRILAMAFE